MERDKDQEGAALWQQWLSPWVVPGQAYARWHRQQRAEGSDPLEDHSPRAIYVEPKSYPD